MVDYWLDSSVFIEGLKGPYGFDLAPRFWIVLDEMAGEGLLACPKMVYDELSDGQDDLADWAKNRKETSLFAGIDAVVQARFRKVCAYVIGRYPDNQSRRRFLDRADPWVIAHAIANGGAAVTHERRNPDGSAKVKIPNVCENFGVRCIDVYRMLRDRGVTWGRLSAFRQNHSPPARAKLWHASRLVARSRQALCGTGAYGRNTPIRPIGNLAPVSNRPYAGRERSAPSGRLPLEPHRRGANFPREPFRSAPPRTAAPGAWCAPSCPPLRIHRARQTRGGPGVCEAERDVWREPALPPVLRRF